MLRGAPSRRIGVLLGLGGVLWSGCPDAPKVPVPDDPYLDPKVAILDAGAPFTRFDGSFGSLLPGSGWAPPDRGLGGPEGDEEMAWVTRRRADLFFEAPDGGPFDLFARCRPFDHEGAPQQTMTVLLRGRSTGTVTLKPGWQEVRIPLPQDVLVPGLNRIRLTFAHNAQVSEVTGDAEDTRRLAAAFTFLAVVPRGAGDPSALTRRATLDPRRRRLTLEPGGGYAAPVGGPGTLRVRLGEVRGGGPEALLAVELERPNGTVDTLWRGAPAAAGDLEVEAEQPSPGPALLRLRRLSSGQGDAGSGKTAVELPPGFVELRPGGPPRQGPPHVFIYMVDTLRADALGLYGARRATSPRLAELARDGVVYERAWSSSAWTLPATVSLLTGVYPFRHRVMTGAVHFSADNAPSLAARLGALGYDTVGISQSWVVSPAFGLDTGFGQFFYSNQLHGWRHRSGEVRRYLAQWLRHFHNPGRPIFAYLHTVDPHSPYGATPALAEYAREAPGALPETEYTARRFLVNGRLDEPAEVAHLRARYDGEVHYADAELGRFVDLLKALNLYEDSLIAVVSDHGEEFGEHGAFDHGRTMWEEMLRVPLVIKYPGSRWAGTRVAREVSTVGLAATLLELAGAAGGEDLDGEVLLPPELADRPRRREVFAEVKPLEGETFAPVDYKALTTGSLKCIWSGTGLDLLGRPIATWQAFDLARDPGEQAPLPEESPGLEECRRRLERWIAAASEAGVPPAGLGDLDDEQRERLRALGYI